MLLRRIARPLLAAVFVVDGVDTLRNPEPRVKAATDLVQRGQRTLPEQYAAKLPADAATLVRVNAIAQVSAGTLLALGRAPRLAALVLAATVVPATVTEQDFWAEADPERKSAKRTAFLKDLGLLGGLMIAAADTEGKPSLGWRGRRAAQGAAAAVSTALPFGAAHDGATGAVLRERAHDAADRARALAAVAGAKGAELAETAQHRGTDWAETAREHGSDWAEKAAEKARERRPELAEAAKEHGAEWAGIAKEHGTEWAETAKARGAKWAEFAKQHGPEWADLARDRGTKWLEAAKQHGPEWAETARDRGAKWAEVAKEHGTEWAEAAKEHGAQWAEVAKERAAELSDATKEQAPRKGRRRR